jgi:hypothetical protein
VQIIYEVEHLRGRPENVLVPFADKMGLDLMVCGCGKKKGLDRFVNSLEVPK